MEGQLQWDGIVLPIFEVTWANVLATARRLEGLDLTEDFFVTYKDEEGDVINVKNEVDLDEAIRWAKEQGVPNLCLEIPFSATDSDSDESWEELDNTSPKTSKPTLLENRVDVSAQKKGEEEESQPASDDEGQEKSELNKMEEKLTDAAIPPQQEETVRADQSQVSEPEASEKLEQPSQVEETKPVQVVTVIRDVLEEVASQSENPVLTLNPIDQVFDKKEAAPTVLTPNPIDEVFEKSANQEAATTPANNLSIDNFVGVVYSANELPTTDGVSDKSVLLDVLSQIEAVRALASLISNEAVQGGIVAVAEAEKNAHGVAIKAASTQLIKVLFKHPELFDVLNKIPNIELALPRLLRSLKAESVGAGAERKPVHDSVVCDGCDANAEQKRTSVENGHCNERGEIVGVRYKSAVLPNYDICETCEASGNFQEHAGPFLKIVDPATAPEAILCVLPGASAGMMSQLESLDWRNPIARKFMEFVKSDQQKSFPQQRATNNPVTLEQAQATVPVVNAKPVEERVKPAAEVVNIVEVTGPIVDTVTEPAVVPASEPVQVVQLRCKHLLKTFDTPHGSFTCDVCMKKQAPHTTMHGCRTCNFDVCQECNTRHRIVPVAPPVVVPAPIATPAPPQAKFVSDVTLADGCVVRPGEKLNKTWRVRNSGAERWPAGTRIAHVGGDSFGGPMNGVEVPLAAPGEAVNVTVPLVMPSQPGRYTSYWRLLTNPHGAKFGHRFWVTVNVVPPSPSTAPVGMVGQIIRPPPPPPTVNLSLPRLPVVPAAPRPPVPPTPPGFVAGSPLIARPTPAARPPPPPPAIAPEEPVVTPELEVAVAEITEFGFHDIDKIVKILKEVNGNTAAAIDRLLEDA